jgi:glycosyltransferase involved in cell wall biosynthesis
MVCFRGVIPVDVLIPTYRRPGALAVTLAGVAAQDHPALRVVLADQTPRRPAADRPEVAAMLRILEARGAEVEVHAGRPRRGVAEQRAFLLERARARFALFLDDDVFIEPSLVRRLVGAIVGQSCGFVGSALIGLSHVDEERPGEENVEWWEGPVQPERVTPDGRAWQRYRLHNAANVFHLQRRLGIAAEDSRLYRVAWVGGCVLYDVEALRRAGGFDFWTQLPAGHSGEDVLAQLRVMADVGGCGLLPSGAYHLELPTTVRDRRVDAPRYLPV